MDINKRHGKYQVRWREGDRRCARTFDRRSDALDFIAHARRRRQLGQAAVAEDVPLAEFVETYWRLHAMPNLRPATRELYRRIWALHIKPRLGEYGVRELTPKRLTRFRAELEGAGVGNATVVKAMSIVQSILSFAVTEELVEYNAGAAVKKPRYERSREPHIFLPAEVEAIRAQLELRDRTLVSVLAYSGPRPEEVVCRLTWNDVGEQTIRYLDTKRGRSARVRFTPLLAPLAEDLREWFLASGRPDGRAPVFPAHDGGFWAPDDWRNWRRRVWQGEPERPRRDRKRATPAHAGCAPSGTRPRDLRSSYITVRVYEGIPLTQIAREVGTSVRMIEQHYAGVIANWDGKQVPAEAQIRRARPKSGRKMDAERVSRPSADARNSLQIR
jgi:site-specific recombinase XerC